MPYPNNTKRINLVNPYRIIRFDTFAWMSDAHERLMAAREAAGYGSASDAAKAMGISVPGYIHHENGTRGLSRSAQRYAAFFRVSLDWLVNGRGPMKGRGLDTVPLTMHVGAGAVIHRVDGDNSQTAIDHIEMPRSDKLSAVRVRGDSQYPRFLDGEIILVDREPAPLRNAIDRYAVVELSDGRQLLKLLRRGTQSHLYRIESHNAPPEDDVRVERAYVVRGSLY